MKKIKVLVVDDSLFFRRFLSKELDKNSEIEVVATAADPFQARDMILRFEPDVMTLDVEMPRMNGVEFLKRLMPQYPLPTVMISSVSDSVFDAMQAGAVDFLEKPVQMEEDTLKIWISEKLVEKIKIANKSRIKRHILKEEKKIATSSNRSYPGKILALGASTGGTEALCQVIRGFHQNIPGTVVVQHMPPGFTKMYAERLDKQCTVEVREAKDGDVVQPGLVLIAPGDCQMRLVRVGGEYRVECKKGEKVSGHCPSVDVLFESVAKTAASNAVGVIMTGMGADGAKGLLKMRKAGAHTIGQDENTCVVYGMPKVAREIGAVEYQMPLENITKKIYNIFNTIP